MDGQRYTVTTMVGDYHLAHQPEWGFESDSLSEARAAALRTWTWLEQGASNQIKTPEALLECCVLVIDTEKDECGERPPFVVGNWFAIEGE